jgi:hypothetical protein
MLTPMTIRIRNSSTRPGIDLIIIIIIILHDYAYYAVIDYYYSALRYYFLNNQQQRPGGISLQHTFLTAGNQVSS